MTKTLTFKNDELVPVANFLANISLKNKASRGRTKLVKLLAAKNDEFDEERKDALDPFILKDGDGKNVEGDTVGSVKLIEEKQDKAAVIIKELNGEAAVIEFTEYFEKFEALYDSLSDYPDNLSDNNAVIYDLLMDQFESVFENETEETK